MSGNGGFWKESRPQWDLNRRWPDEVAWPWDRGQGCAARGGRVGRAGGSPCRGLGLQGRATGRLHQWPGLGLGAGSVAPSPSKSHLWCPGGFCSLVFIGPSPSFAFRLCAECHGPQRARQNRSCPHWAWKDTFGPRHPDEAGRASWRRWPEEGALGLHGEWWAGTCSVNCDTQGFRELLASAQGTFGGVAWQEDGKHLQGIWVMGPHITGGTRWHRG